MASYPNAAVSVNGRTTFCQGDSVQLIVESNPVYTYQWKLDNNNLTNVTNNSYTVKLVSGVYSVKMTNTLANCAVTSGQTTVTVNSSPASPAITVNGQAQFCQGDSVILSITDNPDYSYQWKLNGGTIGSDTSRIVAKTSGTYNMVVSNIYGCYVNSADSVDIKVNPLPSVSNISLSGSPSFCQGGSVTLSVPVTTGYIYNWRNEYGLIDDANTNSYTASASGTFQLEISNSSGCAVKTSAVSVAVKPSPYKPVIESANYFKDKCPGESTIRLSTSQAIANYRYQWYKDGVSLTGDTLSQLELFEAGNYKIEANLGCCTSQSDVFNISLPDAPPKPLVYVRGPTVWYLACSNTSAARYKWYCNDKLIEGADKYYYVANRRMGDYKVSIANTLGCYSVSDVVTIPTGVTGIEDSDMFEGLNIYPNPTKGLFTVEMDNEIFGELMISIITEQGKDILSVKFEKATEHFSGQIDLSGQAKGMYIINLLIENYSATRKVIVE